MRMSSHPTRPLVVIRTARGSDGPALADLAELDSAPGLTRPVLVAELDGRIVAARAPGGAAVADPFVATAGLLELLELHARRTAEPPRHRPARRRRWLHIPRVRAA